MVKEILEIEHRLTTYVDSLPVDSRRKFLEWLENTEKKILAKQNTNYLHLLEIRMNKRYAFRMSEKPITQDTK